MTTGSMYVDSHGLRQTAPAFAELASTVDGVLSRLGSALDAEGACWGPDRIGSAFAESYVPAADQARAALQGLREAVSAVGEALLVVADNVDAADARATQRLK